VLAETWFGTIRTKHSVTVGKMVAPVDCEPRAERYSIHMSVRTRPRFAMALSVLAAVSCSSGGGSGTNAFGVSGSAAGAAAANQAGAGSPANAPAGAAGSVASANAGRSGASGASAGASGAPLSAAGMNAAPAAAGAPSGAGAGGAAGAAGATAGQGGVTATAGQGGAMAAGQGGATATAGSGSPPARDKKFVGNITTRGQVRTDFEMYWDQITPENEGKWGSVEATRDQMNWSPIDRIHDYAVAHGILFKQHNFVWGSQQPSWLSGLSAADQRAEVEEWIRLFCERYPDVALIDVVNEPPPHTNPVYMNALGGAGASGYDWIVQTFKWARQYCPKAILILNDYNTIEYANDNSHFIDIVNKIKAAGAPIDAIGAQAHDAYKLSNATVQGFVDKLAATGLPVYITEYDINLASDSDQQKVMSTQFPMFWNDKHVAGITLWGYLVGATWEANTGLLNTNGTPRPALSWLKDYLKR
jgi:endo-1,4-beta-xylanase